MKWIKYFHIDKNIMYKKKVLENFFGARSPLFWVYVGITFVLGYQLEKELYSYKANQFFLSSKKV